MSASAEQTGEEMNEVNQEPDLLALKFLYSNTDAPKDNTEPISSSSSGTTSMTPLPAYLSALAAKPRAAPRGPGPMEQMRAELRELRDELDTLKTQHKKEIKLLMNELDEEKKMRLSLQIEVERLKKHMSKWATSEADVTDTDKDTSLWVSTELKCAMKNFQRLRKNSGEFVSELNEHIAI